MDYFDYPDYEEETIEGIVEDYKRETINYTFGKPMTYAFLKAKAYEKLTLIISKKVKCNDTSNWIGKNKVRPEYAEKVELGSVTGIGNYTYDLKTKELIIEGFLFYKNRKLIENL